MRGATQSYSHQQRQTEYEAVILIQEKASQTSVISLLIKHTSHKADGYG